MNVNLFHSITDKFIAAAATRLPENLKPCCSKCLVPHCCSEPAYCDDKEADAMLESLHPKQLAEVEERTKAWLEKARPFLGEKQPNAFKYRLANIPCPLLDNDGRCMAYENRPFGCRMFLALGEPEDCAMPARKHQKFADYPQPNAMTPYHSAYVEANCPVELDHIGAHFVRKLLEFPDFTTASHERYELEPQPTPTC